MQHQVSTGDFQNPNRRHGSLLAAASGDAGAEPAAPRQPERESNPVHKEIRKAACRPLHHADSARLDMRAAFLA